MKVITQIRKNFKKEKQNVITSNKITDSEIDIMLDLNHLLLLKITILTPLLLF